MNEPLIWTTDGNVPLAGLDYKPEWFVSEEQVRFIEEYRRKSDGEIVKRNVHVVQLQAPGMGAATGRLN